MDYLISIIIPTKNRYKYLKHCLESLGNLDNKLVEVIIQDNSSDNNEITHFLQIKKYINVKYYYDNN